MKTLDFISKWGNEYWKLVERFSVISRIVSLIMFALIGLMWSLHLRLFDYAGKDVCGLANNQYCQNAINNFWMVNISFFIIAFGYLLRWLSLQFKHRVALRSAQAFLIIALTPVFSAFVELIQISIKNMEMKAEIQLAIPPIFTFLFWLTVVTGFHQITILSWSFIKGIKTRKQLI